jgi:hypothetical protein
MKRNTNNFDCVPPGVVLPREPTSNEIVEMVRSMMAERKGSPMRLVIQRMVQQKPDDPVLRAYIEEESGFEE